MIAPKVGRFDDLHEATEFAALHRDHWEMQGTWKYHHADGTDAGAGSQWFAPTGIEPLDFARGADGWRVGSMPTPRPMFALPGLLASDPRLPVHVLPSEWIAAMWNKGGLLSTTCAGGYAEAEHTNWEPLRGRVVQVLRDWNGDPEGHAARLDALLRDRFGVDVRNEVGPFGLALGALAGAWGARTA